MHRIEYTRNPGTPNQMILIFTQNEEIEWQATCKKPGLNNLVRVPRLDCFSIDVTLYHGRRFLEGTMGNAELRPSTSDN